MGDEGGEGGVGMEGGEDEGGGDVGDVVVATVGMTAFRTLDVVGKNRDDEQATGIQQRAVFLRHLAVHTAVENENQTAHAAFEDIQHLALEVGLETAGHHGIRIPGDIGSPVQERQHRQRRNPVGRHQSGDWTFQQSFIT